MLWIRSHKVQNDSYKNYVVEISSNSQNNVIDKLTPYRQQNTIIGNNR